MNDIRTISFGEQLRAFRKRLRINQHHLAQKLGIHRNTIGRWERGDFLPESKTMLLEIARQLHLNDLETHQLLEASLIVPAPHWWVPLPRNPFFTGREEILQKLHTQLHADRATALQGLGGIGKTQVALEYAYRHAPEYNAIFWIGADTVESMITSLLGIAEVLQLSERGNQDPQRVITTVQRWLTTHYEWLLIWDNLEDFELLTRFLPSAYRGTLLLTTRHQALGRLASGLALESMRPEEGKLFLLRRACVLPRKVTDEQVHQFAQLYPSEYAAAEELVTTLGGFPLALDQAGAYMEETKCSFSHYLSLYKSQRYQLLDRRGSLSFDHPHSAVATIELVCQHVARESLLALVLLHFCTYLSPDAIPEELFTEGATYLGPVLEHLTDEPSRLDRALAILRSVSLVQRYPETQTFSLHVLVQTVLRDQMSEHERVQWLQRALYTLNAVFPDMATESITIWRRGERLLPHALAVTAICADHLASRDLATLLVKIANYLCERAQYDLAKPLYERVLAICKQTLESEYLLTIHALNGLANLYIEQGKFAQAEALGQQALYLHERFLQSSHELASSLSTLANLYLMQGRYTQAEPLFLQVLHLEEQTFGPQHPSVIIPLSRLGLVYLRQGKYAQAEALLRRALQAGEQAFGSRHPQIVQPFTYLGLLYGQQCKYKQAEMFYRRALEILEQQFGKEYHGSAYILIGLAALYKKQKKYEQAALCYRLALSIREQSLGTEHYLVATTLSNLADLYAKQEQDEQAEQMYQRVMHLCKQGRGSERASLAYPLSLSGLATLYVKQGREKQAETFYRRALHIWEQTSAYPEVVMTLSMLASLYLKQNRTEEAELVYQRALSTQRQHLDERIPEIVQMLQELAILRQKQGQASEVVTLAECASLIHTQFLGKTHIPTVVVQKFSTQLVHYSEGGVAVEQATASAYGTRDEHMRVRRIVSSQVSAIVPSSENDPLQEFLRACCEWHPRAWCRVSDLWQAYERWTQEQQERFPLSRRAFAAQLKAHGCHAARTNQSRIWRGITLLASITRSDTK